MKRSIQEVAAALSVAPESPGFAAWGRDTLITGWSVDSRTLQPGDLFFALRGPNHDGHEYIDEVLRKGAAAVVANQSWSGSSGSTTPVLRVPMLRVDDSLLALQTLASWARRKWGGDVVAVTGSAGKTTSKDVIAALLAERVATAKNEGNLNNHVGLPLSLLRLDESARVAVLEIGMNHADEIRQLATIARPQIGVVTNVGYAHIENFDSMEGIAAAKRELIESLPQNGVAVLNADDTRVAEFSKSHPGRSILYGQLPAAEVRGEDVEYINEGVRFRVGTTRFTSPLSGRHNVSNILAGIAVAGIYGIPPAALPERVAKLQPGKMRGQRYYHREVLIFNDCYNSNPDAVRAMLDVLKDTPARRRIAVLGEMLELGRWAEPLHRDVGKYAAGLGIHVLIGIRGAACYMLDAAKAAGLRADAAFFFENPEDAGRLLRTLAQPGDAVLFKGSRGVHVERALETFQAASPDAETGGSS